MTTNPLEQLHDPTFRGFASDNYSGVLPEVLAALAVVNGGHQRSYGNDVYTAALGNLIRETFGDQATVYPVFNGTGANVVSLDMVVPRWGGVVCARSAHINTDECGAPEKIAGLKLMPVDTPDGKMTPALMDHVAWGFGDEHHTQPSVLSITQSTELGTVYTLDELRAVADHAHSLGMRVHLDGARLFNGAAALGCSLREMTTDIGADILSLGGTKHGLMGAEAVVVLNPELLDTPMRGLFVRKLDGQLNSKMRFTSAQLLTILRDDLWKRGAEHANGMAQRLADAVRDVVQITREPQANAVFAILPPAVTVRLQEKYPFYVWNEATGEVRWMCSFDTTQDDIDTFAALVREEMDRG